MKRLFRTHWFTSLLMITMPFALFYWLSSQMAYGQVQREYEIFAALTEQNTVAALQTTLPGTPIFVRGVIEPLIPEPATDQATDLFIYQARPLDGREVRFGEAFALQLPPFQLVLTDGAVMIQPGPEEQRLLSHELHQTTVADRAFTGFQIGDTVTVQGKWQPANAQNTTAFIEVTGVFGVAQATLLTEVKAALQTVGRVKNLLGLVTLVGILLLIMQVYRQRQQEAPKGSETWQPPTIENPTML